ncbi:MAG: GMC family oxidoreductase [Pseudomonadota bacterium]
MAGQYDVIIVGSGAGGSAAAYRLVKAGKRVLVLEKGGYLPRDGSTLDVKTVFKTGRFKNQEHWVDKDNKEFIPGEFYNVGGKTKWYGAALLRFSAHEFAADPTHQCLAWPFGVDELAPYYDEAEALLHVNHFDNEPELQALIDRIVADEPAWRPEPLPLGLKKEVLDDPVEVKHFDGFASACGYKSDAEWNLLDLISDDPNFALLTEKTVVGFLHADGAPTEIVGVRCTDGSVYTGATVILAAGALTSPRILQDHLASTGLNKTLPSADNIGSNFKFHINTAILAVSAFQRHDVLRKTTIFFNDAFPHSTIQCLGWMDGDIVGTQLPAAIPKFVDDAAGSRAIGFFATTEDGSSPDNRVMSCGASGLPLLDYDLDRIRPSRDEHHALVRTFLGRLLRAGLIGAERYAGLAGTAHAIGTLVTGDDPRSSAVDATGKVHGMGNLYVGDGSVLPRTSRVNPALTIYAWGLRLGDHLAHSTG